MPTNPHMKTHGNSQISRSKQANRDADKKGSDRDQQRQINQSKESEKERVKEGGIGARTTAETMRWARVCGNWGSPSRFRGRNR